MKRFTRLTLYTAWLSIVGVICLSAALLVGRCDETGLHRFKPDGFLIEGTMEGTRRVRLVCAGCGESKRGEIVGTRVESGGAK